MMERLFVLLLLTGAAYSKFISNSDESVDDDHFYLLSKRNFDLNTYMKSKLPRGVESLHGQKLVDYVNQRQNLWVARLNKFNTYSEDLKPRLMGVEHVRNSVTARKTLAKSKYSEVKVPDSFDARTQWPDCPSIRSVRDQSSCGSCWAFGAVEAISDRICVASEGKIKVNISATDLLSCCRSCGFGCNGGEPLHAWKFWVKEGIVTGSDFHTNEGCQPYPFPPCEHHNNHTYRPPCKKELYPTPKCIHTCDSNYSRQYSSDKFYGKKAYAVDDDEESIKKELFMNGPLEVAFEVYEDFLDYAGGVYVHQAGSLEGGHAVKLIGWGEDNGVPYWLVVNSWNTDWGENGLFRILRGADECGIEGGVVGGIPDFERSPSS